MGKKRCDLSISWDLSRASKKMRRIGQKRFAEVDWAGLSLIHLVFTLEILTIPCYFHICSAIRPVRKHAEWGWFLTHTWYYFVYSAFSNWWISMRNWENLTINVAFVFADAWEKGRHLAKRGDSLSNRTISSPIPLCIFTPFSTLLGRKVERSRGYERGRETQ